MTPSPMTFKAPIPTPSWTVLLKLAPFYGCSPMVLAPHGTQCFAVNCKWVTKSKRSLTRTTEQGTTTLPKSPLFATNSLLYNLMMHNWTYKTPMTS